MEYKQQQQKRLVFYTVDRSYYWLANEPPDGTIRRLDRQEFKELEPRLTPLDKGHSLVENIIWIVTGSITLSIILYISCK